MAASKSSSAQKSSDQKSGAQKSSAQKPDPMKNRARTPRKPVAGETGSDGKPVAIASAAPHDAGGDGARQVLKLKALIEEVKRATDGKQKVVKATVEATLAALGAALTRGEDLNLPPLGRARVARSKDNAGTEMLVVKLRRGPEKREKKVAFEGLAEGEEGM